MLGVEGAVLYLQKSAVGQTPLWNTMASGENVGERSPAGGMILSSFQHAVGIFNFHPDGQGHGQGDPGVRLRPK